VLEVTRSTDNGSSGCCFCHSRIKALLKPGILSIDVAIVNHPTNSFPHCAPVNVEPGWNDDTVNVLPHNPHQGHTAQDC